MAWPRWLPEPFITALLGAVVLAALLPAHGVIALWVDGLVTAAIMLLFFMHGVKLPRDALWAALVNWRLHGAIVATTFVLFPMLGLGLHFLLPGLLYLDSARQCRGGGDGGGIIEPVGHGADAIDCGPVDRNPRG